MDLKNYATGIQHVGIPTGNMEATLAFYQKLGFETAYETLNDGKRVAFLKLKTLVIETYESDAPAMKAGAIDHVAIDVADVEAVYRYINENALNNTHDSIHFLPFWANGVRFFTIEGPNKEKVEFSQML
ncbi:MAG: VOC family protein [Eubacteriales bacterium]|nr:VOC family protein [Eubacteriales bacterium]